MGEWVTEHGDVPGPPPSVQRLQIGLMLLSHHENPTPVPPTAPPSAALRGGVLPESCIPS